MTFPNARLWAQCGVLALCAGMAGVVEGAQDPAAGPTSSEDRLPAGVYADAPRQLTAVMHAHTRATSGSETTSQLSQRAADAGLDVVVLTENLGYEFRYAPSFLRPFVEARASTETLEDHGFDRFIAEVNETERLRPRPLLLVGVEVPAYYYWRGSLFTGDLTLYDMQRNVLVVAPPAPGTTPGRPAHNAAYFRDFLENLPAVGNQHHRHYGPRSALLLLPGIALIGWASRSLVRRGVLRSRSYRSRYRLSPEDGRYVRRKPVHQQFGTWLFVGLLLAGVTLLAVNFPYSVYSIHPYDSARGHQPFENLFRYARDAGGHTFWSMPEAVDHHLFELGPVSVRLATHRYPDVITDTEGYTGFGGVYADTITTTDPGNHWDQAIAAYRSGARDRFPVLVSESAFHFPGQAGKQLADMVTVLLVDEVSHQAAFDALVGGRSYSVRQDAGGPALRLTEFAAARVGGPGDGAAAARSGETLLLDGPELEVALRIDDQDRAGVDVDVELIREGRIHRRFSGTTPVRLQWLETLEPAEEATDFRVVVRGPEPSYAVSNPIFVRRRP